MDLLLALTDRAFAVESNVEGSSVLNLFCCMRSAIIKQTNGETLTEA